MGEGVFGEDFGPRLALAAMADLSTSLLWLSGRLNLNGANIGRASGYLIQGRLTTGFADVATTMLQQVHLRDFAFDSNWGSDNGIIQGAQAQDVLIEFGMVSRYRLACVAFQRGVVRNCLLHSTGQNIINAGAGKTEIYGSFLMMPGLKSSGQLDPHGDGIEANRTSDFWVYWNTIYMPAAGTAYDNGDLDAQVNCIRHSCDMAGHQIANSYAAGNALYGTNPAMTIRPRYNGCKAVGVLRAFNRYGGPEYESGAWGHQLMLRAPESGTAIWKNIAVFDEYYANGTPITVGGSAVPASYAARTPDIYRPHEHRWGVFDYDKNDPDPLTGMFIEVLQLIGRATGRDILDANNDLNPAYNLGNLRTAQE